MESAYKRGGEQLLDTPTPILVKIDFLNHL